MPALRLPLALALAAALVAVGAGVLLLTSGGDSSTSAPATERMLSQPQIQALRCRDWEQLDIRPRAQVLAGLRSILGGDVIGRGASGRGSVLRDEQARRLFDGYCRRPFAREFSLYKLYGQAAGFAGQPSPDSGS
jgi:hypothetical protein